MGETWSAHGREGEREGRGYVRSYSRALPSGLNLRSNLDAPNRKCGLGNSLLVFGGSSDGYSTTYDSIIEREGQEREGKGMTGWLAGC